MPSIYIHLYDDFSTYQEFNFQHSNENLHNFYVEFPIGYWYPTSSCMGRQSIAGFLRILCGFSKTSLILLYTLCDLSGMTDMCENAYEKCLTSRLTQLGLH